MWRTRPCFCGAPAAPRLRIDSFAPPTKRRKPARRVVAACGEVPKRVAVVGGGLAGLATAYHLLHSTARVARKRGADFTDLRVVVLDPGAPGAASGASAVAAGLLHPFSPRVKKQAWHALKGMHAALTLVDAAQMYADAPLIKTPGMLRFALTDKLRSDFKSAKLRFPRDVQLLSPDDVEAALPDPPEGVAGVMQTETAVVDTPAYMRALWDACDATGRVEWDQRRVDHWETLLQSPDDFDAVVVCAGAATRALSNMASLPVTPCRGQNLRLRPRFPDTTRPPAFPVIGGKYVIPDLFAAEPGALIAGATFEYCDADGTPREKLDFAAGVAPPDLAVAQEQLREPLSRLAPMLDELYAAESAVAGVRALPPRSKQGSVPIAGEIKGVPDGKAAWVFTALGSRGLLHHAYLGKLVARCVVAGSDVLLPVDAKRVPLVYEELAGEHRPETACTTGERPRGWTPAVFPKEEAESALRASK